MAWISHHRHCDKTSVVEMGDGGTTPRYYLKMVVAMAGLSLWLHNPQKPCTDSGTARCGYDIHLHVKLRRYAGVNRFRGPERSTETRRRFPLRSTIMSHHLGWRGPSPYGTIPVLYRINSLLDTISRAVMHMKVGYAGPELTLLQGLGTIPHMYICTYVLQARVH